MVDIDGRWKFGQTVRTLHDVAFGSSRQPPVTAAPKAPESAERVLFMRRLLYELGSATPIKLSSELTG